MLTTKTETITPALAEKYLRFNEGNRPMSLLHARALAEEMKNGRWMENGTTIKFSKTGRLLDGQHRLRAVILADTDVPMLVVRGLETDQKVFESIDTGQSIRTCPQVLSANGEVNVKTLSGALVWVVKYEEGIMDGNIPCRTNTKILEFLRWNPGIRTSVPVAQRAGHLLPPTMGAALHYMFSKADRDMADEMFEGLAKGFDRKATDPFYVLQQSLVRRKTARTKSSIVHAGALTVKAWNAQMVGRPVSQLKWLTGEEFPEIYGFKREK